MSDLDDLWREDEPETRAVQRDAGGLWGWLAESVDAEQVRAAGAEGAAGESHFIASTGSVDRMGDVIEQETWRLANFRRNPVILHEHAHPVVGRGVARLIEAEGGKCLGLSVTWDDGDHNPIGRLVAEQHRRRFRSAVSVGFRPGKVVSRKDLPDEDPRKVSGDVPTWRAGSSFRFNELLEVSSVAIPANPDALQLASYAREAESQDEQIRRALDETAPRLVRDAVLELIRRDAEVRKAVHAILLSMPGANPASNNAGIPWLNRG